MATSSREKKRRAQASEKTGERKTQGRKREAGSLPGSKTAEKAQKGAWETQLFYVIDLFSSTDRLLVLLKLLKVNKRYSIS